jgi:hypothetical protein
MITDLYYGQEVSTPQVKSHLMAKLPSFFLNYCTEFSWKFTLSLFIFTGSQFYFFVPITTEKNKHFKQEKLEAARKLYHSKICRIVLCCVVLCCIVLYCAVLYCIVLCCVVLYCIACHHTKYFETSIGLQIKIINIKSSSHWLQFVLKASEEYTQHLNTSSSEKRGIETCVDWLPG